ncbi:hypothetical protein ANN_18155 [Periplaneta americana]|uniref:Uncharacterized protein n=1 Tax=Periplaneta americana TaxID=6978 RepID=A0ABQ8SMY6_PERAM|nr:hypothetical protein ANN_18155 [Periplaneta americana]
MGDSGTFTVLTRYESMRLRCFTKVKEPLRGTRYNTKDELTRAIGRSIRNINKDGRANGVRRVHACGVTNYFNNFKWVLNEGENVITSAVSIQEQIEIQNEDAELKLEAQYCRPFAYVVSRFPPPAFIRQLVAGLS